MHETTKTERLKTESRRAAVSSPPSQRSIEDAPRESALQALAERIGQDARDGAADYLRRSDTAQHGE